MGHEPNCKLKETCYFLITRTHDRVQVFELELHPFGAPSRWRRPSLRNLPLLTNQILESVSLNRSCVSLNAPPPTSAQAASPPERTVGVRDGSPMMLLFRLEPERAPRGTLRRTATCIYKRAGGAQGVVAIKRQNV